MRTETNDNRGLNDRDYLNQTDLPDTDSDEDKKESEFNPPSQPAEEHLITEANELKTDVPPQDYEDTDQGPEEIDPVNHPRNFHNIPFENQENH